MKISDRLAYIIGFVVAIYGAVIMYDATARIINDYGGLSTLKVLFIGTLLYQVAKYVELALWVLIMRALTGKWYGSNKNNSRSA